MIGRSVAKQHTSALLPDMRWKIPAIVFALTTWSCGLDLNGLGGGAVAPSTADDDLPPDEERDATIFPPENPYEDDSSIVEASNHDSTFSDANSLDASVGDANGDAIVPIPVPDGATPETTATDTAIAVTKGPEVGGAPEASVPEASVTDAPPGLVLPASNPDAVHCFDTSAGKAHSCSDGECCGELDSSSLAWVWSCKKTCSQRTFACDEDQDCPKKQVCCALITPSVGVTGSRCRDDCSPQLCLRSKECDAGLKCTAFVPPDSSFTMGICK